MYTHNLLRKTELHILGIALENADLNQIAKAVAATLALDAGKVLVTDVQRHRVTVDILTGTVDASRITGSEKALLEDLSRVNGVSLRPDASVRADGMLGWIAADDTVEVREALARSQNLAKDIAGRIEKRAIVFSTGPEVAGGEIRDTNMPAISEALERHGFTVTGGGVLGDDDILIAGVIRNAIEGRGYGLVVTTGGVGAEKKDRTVEALLLLDPDAATPYVCRFEKGTGRHVKEGVRIAVGEFGGALIVALPGPNDEVKLSLDVLCAGLDGVHDIRRIAESMAEALRKHLRAL